MSKLKSEDYYLKRLIAIHNKYEDDIECNHSYSDGLLVDILHDLDGISWLMSTKAHISGMRNSRKIQCL